MTEVTDSTILVVSEETGQLSVARNGKMFKNLTPVELRQKLNLYLFEDEGTIAEAERGLKWAEVADWPAYPDRLLVFPILFSP